MPSATSATSATPSSTSSAGASEPRRSARERLLAAADELFYTEGVQTVGIDRVIERAGVAKASLYHCFASKEELVAAYLRGRREQIMVRINAAVDGVEDPREKVLAVFASQAQQLGRADFRGCAFAAASTEAPSGGLIDDVTQEHRTWLRDLFTSLVREAGATDPARLGRQLQLLYDGASLAARLEGPDLDIATSAREAAEALLDLSIPAPRRSRKPR